jgi:folate-binding protein YgfZ
VLGHVMLLRRPEAILLWGAPGQAAALVRHLERYIIREDVALADLSAEERLVAIVGKDRWNVLGWGAADDRHAPLANCSRKIGDFDVVVATCDWFGPDAVLLQVPAPSLESVEAFLIECGVLRLAASALEALRLESGTPLVGIDFDANNLPQEIHRDERAISFTKGCYLGQETVARIDALGHVNKRLVSVRFSGPAPRAGAPLLAGDNEVGRVTSAAWSPRHEAPIGLAMVRREHSEAGTTLTSANASVEVFQP